MAGTQTQIFVTETKQILNTLSLRSLKREKAKKKKKTTFVEECDIEISKNGRGKSTGKVRSKRCKVLS